jgi:hypothetical protein
MAVRLPPVLQINTVNLLGTAGTRARPVVAVGMDTRVEMAMIDEIMAARPAVAVAERLSETAAGTDETAETGTETETGTGNGIDEKETEMATEIGTETADATKTHPRIMVHVVTTEAEIAVGTGTENEIEAVTGTETGDDGPILCGQ